jgi:hypothetical protein
MQQFFSWIDLSDNLSRALAAVRGIHGPGAYVLATALALITYFLAMLAWYFDIGATWDWAQPAVTTLSQYIPGEFNPQVVTGVSALLLLVTVAPTLIELFTARFAVTIPAAAALVFSLCLFDAVTDYPRVAEFLQAYKAQGVFDSLGILALPVYAIAHPLLLFMASFGFELLTIVFGFTALVLVAPRRKGKKRKGRQTVEGTADGE